MNFRISYVIRRIKFEEKLFDNFRIFALICDVKKLTFCVVNFENEIESV